METKPMTDEVYSEIKQFIFSGIDDFRGEYDGLDLTVAVGATGRGDQADQWNYQTGDNSFTGGAYGLPYWAVTTIWPDTDPVELYNDIIDQLEEQLYA